LIFRSFALKIESIETVVTHMTILGIETSCDETAIALVKFSKKGTTSQIEIITEKIASQIKIHEEFGGVFPALAAREHLKNIDRLFSLTKISNKIINNIGLISVTNGPGLIPCLVIGSSFAKALSYKHKKPIIGTNHLEGHLFSGLLKETKKHDLKNIEFPAIGLIVSGGHTELVLVESFKKYTLLGETLDDAAGEAFDKVARLLGLGYPGGPLIEKLAPRGDSQAFSFPRPMIGSKNHNFSFSGLKTAVLYAVRDYKKKVGIINDDQKLPEKLIKDIAASFQEAVIETLISKLKFAIQEFSPKTLLFGGGVLANQALSKRLLALGISLDIKTLIPPKKYCGDNAVMIALAAYLSNKKSSWQKVEADANLNLS